MATEYFRESKDKKDGSTTTSGTGVITLLDNGSLKAEVSAKVTKSGLTGTGKGSMSLILLKIDGQPFQVINAGATVGAKVPQGVNHKNDSNSLTLFPSFASTIVAAQLVVNTSDDKGYPTSIPDLIKMVGDIDKQLSDAGFPSLRNLPMGSAITLGDSIIKRFK